MALFGASTPADPMLASVLRMSPTESYWNKIAEKALAKESEAILQELRRLKTSALLVTHSFRDGDIGVVTGSAVFTVKRSKVTKCLPYDEIVETEIRQLSNQGNNKGMLVLVESRTARNDYNPDDYRRFGHIISLQVPTPGIANEICGIIDSRI